MKILHVLISKGFAGSELYAINLLNYQSQNHRTFLIKNSKSDENKYKKFLNNNVKTYDLKGFFKKIKINKMIAEIEPDIVHTHLGNASKIISKKNFKLVSTIHMNYQLDHYNQHDGIIVSNQTQFKKASESFKGKIKNLYLWPLFNNKFLKSNDQLKKELSIPSKSFIFGSVGRFHKQKGFDIVYESFKNLNLENAFLILIGNGYDEYKHYKYKNVILLDHQDNIQDYYKLFDCYISASRWESFGIALIEAMYFSLPIITTVHEGNQDWISDYDVEIFENENIDQLKKKIIKTYNTGPKSIKYNLNRFDYNIICEDILKFYNDL